MSAQPVSVDAPIDEELLFTIFVECFGDQSKSPFVTTLFEAPTTDDIT